jgi:hypothetical protein
MCYKILNLVDVVGCARTTHVLVGCPVYNSVPNLIVHQTPK